MANAARKLGITQAAVSQNISKIEVELGTTLIDRSLRPLRLTPAGTVLRSRARHLLDLAQETRIAVRGTGQPSLPKLRLAVLNSLAGSLLPTFFDDLTQSLNIDSLTLWSGFTIEHNEALLNREVDAIMTSEPMENVDELEVFEILQEPFIVALPAGYAVKDFDLDTIGEDLPLMRYSARNLMGRLIDQHLRRLRISIPRRIEFDSSWSIGRMISSGRGWAIMTPVCLLEANLSPDQVQCMAFPKVSFSRRLYIVTRSGELGELPARIAAICRQTLDNDVRQEIRGFGNWLADALVVPAGTANRNQ